MGKLLPPHPPWGEDRHQLYSFLCNAWGVMSVKEIYFERMPTYVASMCLSRGGQLSDQLPWLGSPPPAPSSAPIILRRLYSLTKF